MIAIVHPSALHLGRSSMEIRRKISPSSIHEKFVGSPCCKSVHTPMVWSHACNEHFLGSQKLKPRISHRLDSIFAWFDHACEPRHRPRQSLHETNYQILHQPLYASGWMLIYSERNRAASKTNCNWWQSFQGSSHFIRHHNWKNSVLLHGLVSQHHYNGTVHIAGSLVRIVGQQPMYDILQLL